MSKIIRVPINPDVLRWALEDLNLSLEDFAEKIGKKPAKVNEWLNGESFPTYNQLEDISYKVLKLPLASFFLSEPPKGLSIKKKFRTLPDYLFEETSYRTRLAIKKADFYKISLYELYRKNPSAEPIFRKQKFTIHDNPVETAGVIRNILEINFEVQKSFNNSYKAFNWYREKLEQFGVFLFQLKLEGDRGFCLLDDELPLIIVNSGDSINSKIFTLFHELIHILINKDDIYKEFELPQYYNDPLEIFCNKVTSEILVPEEEFIKRYSSEIKNWNENFIKRAANEYSVSREVILLKLVNLKFAVQSDYDILKQKWLEEYLKSKKGGNYYINKISALGKGFIYTVIDYYKKGLINDLQVSNYLDMKFSNISRIESEVYVL